MKEIEDDKTASKIDHAHGLEDIITITILSKKSTDSMQFLSKYQWHSSQNQNKQF